MIIDILIGAILAVMGIVAAYFGVYWLMFLCFAGALLDIIWVEYIMGRD